MAETKWQRFNLLQAQMETERSSFDSHYRELGDHFAPRRTRFWTDDRNRGDKRHNRVVNEAGFLSARTLRSGMFAGITSPARPWRRLSTPDPDLADYGPVKDWLFVVNKRMRTLDLRSNLYHVLPTTYGDMGVFALGAMGVFDDQEDMMRCYNYPVGSYWIARNERGQVDTFMRKYQMTVRQLVMKFGDPQAGPTDRWKNFSVQVKNAWDRGQYETFINVTHLTTPNMDFDPRKLDAKYSKRYASCYYEQGAMGGGQTDQGPANDRFLRESGFDYFPFLVPSWELTGEDTYATSCPGMEALAACKELQLTEKRVSRAIEKQLNPALQGPPELRNQKASLLAGDITYINEMNGKGGLKPIHEVTMAIDKVEQRIERIERRISRCFYEDLFLMLAQMEGIQPRNEAEIAERHEEKLLALGPVLEGTNDALLDPLTDIEFAIMQRFGWVPDPPEELAGQDLRVEYESIMAKAQKLVGVAGTERFIAFAGNMAAAFPDVLDRVDADQVIDEYGDMMGVSSQVIRPIEAAQQIRQQRAKAQQAAQMAERVPQMAGAAKQLSETDTSSDNALTRLLAGA
ncbi:MAG: portal protein [Burkholderiales bacterium]